MELPDVHRDRRGPRRTEDGDPTPRGIPRCWRPDRRATARARRALPRSRRGCSARPTAPFFIDKMPNNFAHVGLIHLILPNAKIIDARRHPLGCCFSGFKQHFARGQNFTYDLDGHRPLLPRLRRADGALRRRCCRAASTACIYEAMVDDTEAEVRRLLDYCGLPFEDACLRFYENERACAPPAPNRSGSRSTATARSLAPLRAWLGPLKEALGPVLDAYPDAPAV